MIMKNKLIYASIFVLLTMVSSCSLFELPTGSCELMDDVYTRDEQGYIEEYFTFGTDGSTKNKHEDKKQEVLISYICATVKITNTSNKNIYNTTINIQAKAGERTYYKTISLDVVITPGSTIYIPIEIEKQTKQLAAVGTSNDDKWDKDSIKIISSYWR